MIVESKSNLRIWTGGEKLTKPRMTRLLAEKAGPVTGGDEEDLHVREKDEGDLFGVRAIEAGYYGGVSQSQPSSVVSSAVSTPRAQTPTSMFSKPNYAQKGPLVSVYPVSTPSSSPVKSSAPVSTYAPQSADKIRKTAPPPMSLSSRKGLQPSDAEKTGRKNHGQVGVEMVLSPPYSSPLRNPPLSPIPNPRPTAPKSKTAPSVSSTSSSSSSNDSRRGSDATTVAVYFPDKPTPALAVENPFENPYSPAGVSQSASIKSNSSSGSSRCTCGHAPPMPSPPAQIAAPSARRQSILAQSARLGTNKAATEVAETTPSAAYSSTVDNAAARHRARQSSTALPSMDENPYARHGATAVQPPSPIDDDEDEESVQEDRSSNEGEAETVSPRTSFSYAQTASEYQRKPSVRIIEPPREPRKLGAGLPLSSFAQPKLIKKVYANQVAGVYAPKKEA